MRAIPPATTESLVRHLAATRRRSPSAPVVAIAVILAAALGLALVRGDQSQVPETPQAQPPTFRLDASYVRVDAYPTVDGKVVTDLTADDFELLEDGVPQRIEQFERVDLARATPREERRDPNTIAEGREQAADPRRRVFVIFLDTGNSTLDGSYRARKPIVDMLERLIGPEDLFAVVTPEMDPRHLTFARRTEGLDKMLERHWTWGRRDSLVRTDPEEQAIERCFPENTSASQCVGPGGQVITQPAYAYRGVARQLIERRSETMALDALNDLVGVLGAVREERKAVVVITQGWFRFQPKPELTRLQECDSVARPRVGVGPDGRIVTDKEVARRLNSVTDAECQQLAMQYAMVDNDVLFRDIVERANRFNVSFYPFDTRGLVPFDRSLGTSSRDIRDDPGERPNRRDPADRAARPSPLGEDRESLNRRIDGMRELAENTDGLAVVNTNDLASGARRIVDDLSTYYLLGYYSTNTNLDGRWRKISVRVKRPGVEVRARRGYRALRPEDMPTTLVGESASSAAGAEAGGTPASAVNEALGPLAGLDAPVPWRSRAAFRLSGEGAARSGHFWVVSEIEPRIARDAAWSAGATLAASFVLPDGTPLAEATATLEPGARLVEIGTDVPLAGVDELVVRLRLRPAESGLPLTDSIRVAVGGGAHALARVFRAGPLTAQRFVPTADQRFRRNERIRVAVPTGDGAVVTAALVDRAGQVLDRIPVAARLDSIDGARWAVGEVALAPLGPGDYVVRLEVAASGRVDRTFTGVRVVN